MIISGPKLAKARARKSKTLVEVAAVAGYKSTERIRQIETGKKVDINPNIVKAIAEFLDVQPEELA